MLKNHVILAIIATVCYAASGVITERYSSKLHVLWMLVLNNGSMIIITAFALGIMRAASSSMEMKITWPTFFFLSFFAGVILFAANYAFYQAFQEGGTLPEIATILCLLPIFSSILRMLFVPAGEEAYAWPTLQVWIGSSLIIGGILLIAFQKK
jgi:uncharacterized membrane protein